MVKISERIRVLELIELEFFGRVLNHNVVIIERGPSGGLMLVDTSLPQNFDQIEKYLNSWGYSIEDISDIVITHFHVDHYGNAETIRRISKAKVYAHKDENFEIKEFSVNEAVEELKVSKEEVIKTIERINKIRAERPEIDIRLKGGEVLGEFEVIHVPGHTKGHIALYNGEVLIAGDAVRNVNGLSPPLRTFSWDYKKAVESFNNLIDMKYKVLVPYHGELFFK
ncbi:MAG: MBL fold metallo-hydrolase [Sulfolobus sp.]